MDQGFISYNSKKNSMFFNNSMKNIVNWFKEKDTLIEKEKFSDNLNVKKKLSRDFLGSRLTSSNEELITINRIDSKVKEEQLFLNLNQNYYNSFLLESNVQSEGKILVERILKNSGNLNSRLPEGILNLFNGSKENILDIIYEKVKNDEKYSSFTYLGVITINNDAQILKNEYENKTISRKYQIMFRVISYDGEENYLEFMFQDVSEVVELEMEKAILNTRSLYLSKIAHEFKNPISAILELTSDIKEITRENEGNFQDKISNKLNYIKDLCGVMCQFLNDYSLFTNLKFSCENNCELNSSYFPQINNNQSYELLIEKQLDSNDSCPTCSSVRPLYCKKCKICKTCENNDKSIFNSINLIKKLNENFRKLYTSEKGSNLANAFTEDCLNFCLDNSRENLQESNLINRGILNKKKSSFVKVDKKLLESALYNLIFFSYRSTSSTKAVTNVQVTCTKNLNSEKDEIIQTKFQIRNDYLEIDKSLIEFLKNSNGNNCSNKAENFYIKNSSSDKFNKFFEIYVASYFIKKLGSELNISSGNDGSGAHLSFTINTKKRDLEDYPCLIDDDFQSDYSEEEFDRTMRISYSKKFIKRPSKLHIFNRSMHSKMTNRSNYNPQTIILEDHDQNIEIELKVPGKQVRILLIDDEPLIRKFLTKHLVNISKINNMTFICEEASNCFEAIDIVYNNYLNNFKFDIIIIDECLPYMKGSTFIKLFKQLYLESNFYNFKIVSYTAFDSEEKKKLIMNSGADQIINKPISFNDFKNVILNLL